MITASCEWAVHFSVGQLLNAIFLGIIVGFAEELIFRGWLWGEINLLIGFKFSVILQAAIFSISHIRFSLGFIEWMTLLLGLFLLGLLLSLRRILDYGSLYGSIGLHGGLVGGWFFINTNLLDISPKASSWIIGPGAQSANPIGSIFAIVLISGILLFYRTAFAIERFPLSGERRAFSSGDIP